MCSRVSYCVHSEAPTNFFGGSPLNRLAWLRTSDHFMNAIVESPAARWLVLKGGQPLLAIDPATEKGKLAQLTTQDVRALLGPTPYFSQGQTEGAHAEAGVSALESARFHGPDVTFLGLQEPESESQALPSTEFSAKNDAVAVVDKIKGTPYFSLDATRLEKTAVDAALESTEAYGRDQKFVFVDARPAMASMDVFYAAVFAEARALVDWNARNRVRGFHVGCRDALIPPGSCSFAQRAGRVSTRSGPVGKSRVLRCSPGPITPGRSPAPLRACLPVPFVFSPLHDFTESACTTSRIRGLIPSSSWPWSTKQTRKFFWAETSVALRFAPHVMLIGRAQRKWPGRFYSALAGFIEPGESFEDAVKRELWEEAGLKVWGIRYHSTQPWVRPPI